MLPSLLFGEPSRAFWLASRAEPSFIILENEPKTSLKFWGENHNIWHFFSVILNAAPFFVNLDQFHANIDPNQVNKLIFCQKFYNVNAWLRYFWEEKLGFPKFSKTSFLKNWASRAKLFDQKLEPKTELSEPSLGSGATLIDNH